MNSNKVSEDWVNSTISVPASSRASGDEGDFFATTTNHRSLNRSTLPTPTTPPGEFVNTMTVMSDNFSRLGDFSTASRSSSLGGFSVKSNIVLPNGEEVTVVTLTEMLKRILPCQDLKYKLTLYRKCFRVNEAIDCFRRAFPEVKDVHGAIAFGRVLQRARIITHVCDDVKPFQMGNYFFRLQCYHQPSILNSYRIASDSNSYAVDPMSLIDILSALLLQIEEDAKTTNRLVDYRRASQSRLFPLLENAAASLQGIDLALLNVPTRLAFCINLYNIMIKYAFMKVGMGVTRTSRSQFFSEVKMNIGGDILSLDDLEHGVIRANRPPPGITSSVPFSKSDHRLRLAMPQLDYRIHFCLDCYPVPSEPITIRPNTLSRDLDRAARSFLSRHHNLWTNISCNEVGLSKIFSWYSSDFAAKDWRSTLMVLELYVTAGKKMDIEKMLMSSKSPTISFMEFDWGTDAKNFHAFKLSNIRSNERWARA